MDHQYDLNGDNYAETIATDLNGDGNFEIVAIDTDSNGTTDLFLIDGDQDGMAEQIGQDVTGDGYADGWVDGPDDGLNITIVHSHVDVTTALPELLQLEAQMLGEPGGSTAPGAPGVTLPMSQPGGFYAYDQHSDADGVSDARDRHPTDSSRW